MSTMKTNQLEFPDLAGSLKDANGGAVDPATMTNQSFASSDPTVATWEASAPDGSPDANGQMAAVAHAVGSSTMTFVATNPNGTLVTLTDTLEVTAVVEGNAVDGPLNFNAPIDKPPVQTAARRR
jgi:hypothetical protein